MARRSNQAPVSRWIVGFRRSTIWFETGTDGDFLGIKVMRRVQRRSPHPRTILCSERRCRDDSSQAAAADAAVAAVLSNFLTLAWARTTSGVRCSAS